MEMPCPRIGTAPGNLRSRENNRASARTPKTEWVTPRLVVKIVERSPSAHDDIGVRQVRGHDEGDGPVGSHSSQPRPGHGHPDQRMSQVLHAAPILTGPLTRPGRSSGNSRSGSVRIRPLETPQR